MAEVRTVTCMEWQTMESAPKDGTWVLLYHRLARIGDWYWDGQKWNNDTLEWSDSDDEFSPSHWMHFDPPKSEASK